MFPNPIVHHPFVFDIGPLSLTDLRSDGARWTWRALGPTRWKEAGA